MFFIKKYLSVFLLFAYLFTYSQQLRFSRIGEEDGLSQSLVNCIIQDSRGYMWIGTQDGLNRYDGYEIKVYKNNPSDTNSLANSYVECLFEDENNNIWIGSKGNIDIYNPSNNTFKHFSSDIVGASVVKIIFQDSEKNIWIGADKGIRYYNPQNNLFQSFDFDIPQEAVPQSKNIWSIVEGDGDMLWLASYGNYIYSFDKKTKSFHSYTIQGLDALSPSCKSVRCIRRLANKNIMVGTEGGMFEFDVSKKKFIKYFSESASFDSSRRLSSNRIASIEEDENYIWVGTIYGGLNIIDKSTSLIISHQNKVGDPYSLSNNSIKCLYKDNSGAIWLGTDNGVNVIFKSANKFQHFKNFGLPQEQINVYSVLVDKNDDLWIGTSGYGLISYNKMENSFVVHENISTGKNKSVLSLHEDEQGLWIGTWGDGLSYFNKTTQQIKKYEPNKNGLDHGTIISLESDSSGNLYVATYGRGVFILKKGEEKFKNISVDQGLSGNYPYCLYMDSNSKLWVGTDATGISVIDIKTEEIEIIQKTKEKNSISSNTINCIIKDSKGNIWVGTSAGLNKYNPSDKSFDRYYEKDGLPNDYIYGIVEDKAGNLWISTNNGISRFNPNVENVNGSAFRNYSVSDGLQGKEFNQGAFCKSKSGEMFFGGTNGFNSFYPEKITINSHQPNVYITGVKLFGKNVKSDTAVADKKYIELSWKENFLSFEFVALDYLMPLQNKYSYKLEGVDEDWSVPGTNRFASYTQLEPNTYTFRVKACNSDGVWNEEGASIVIRIIPPFWKTKWFYALCVILFISSVFAFIRWRTSSIKKEKKILEAKVEERTRELAEKNRDITSSIQYAKRIQEAILPPVDTVYNHFPESFILYKPKDIVSGDFYWFAEKNGKKIIAAVDCTGHGVPGAFMSMIGHNLLNQIVVENGFTDPATILNELHKGVQSALKQGTSVVDTSDGMDVALCVFDEKHTQVTYAGAMRPLFYVSDNNLEKISGNKFSIGGAQLDTERRFTNHQRFLKKGDKLYLFSDGYADQFGGEKGKKFMLRNFSEMLIEIKQSAMNEQSKLLNETIEKWREGYEQVDDILVIGITV